MTQELHTESVVLSSKGPNRWALILDAFANKKSVEFELGHISDMQVQFKQKVMLVVNKIENLGYPDEPCDIWYIWGYLAPSKDEDQLREKLCKLMGLHFQSVQSESRLRFVATYNTVSRTGRFKFSFDSESVIA